MSVVIAIDGPSGSGKSTVARTIAERLEFPYLDTGAMYRAVGCVAMDRGVKFEDAASLVKIAAELKLQLLDDRTDGRIVLRVLANGADVTAQIRSPEATHASSSVAVHPEVRDRLVRRQRNWVQERGGAVVEGRDIGSVVFPQAILKVFLTADDAERARRRGRDDAAPEFANLSADALADELARRDARDSQRDVSPLVVMSDSYVIDTTDRDIEEIVMEIMGQLRERNGGKLPQLSDPTTSGDRA